MSTGMSLAGYVPDAAGLFKNVAAKPAGSAAAAKGVLGVAGIPGPSPQLLSMLVPGGASTGALGAAGGATGLLGSGGGAAGVLGGGAATGVAAAGAAAAAVASAAMAVAGAVHAVKDEESVFHEYASSRWENIQERWESITRLGKLIKDIVVPAFWTVADFMGAGLMFQLSAVATALGTVADAALWAANKLELIKQDGLDNRPQAEREAELAAIRKAEHEKKAAAKKHDAQVSAWAQQNSAAYSMFSQSYGRDPTMNEVKQFGATGSWPTNPEGSLESSGIVSEALRAVTEERMAKERQANNAKHPGGAGTNIQKVEIVVTSNQEPSRIARMVLQEIQTIQTHPRVSRYAPNYTP